MLKNFGRMDVKMPLHTLVNVENLLQHALAAVHTYIEWKNNHPVLAKQPQIIADQPVYYQLFPNETISFSIILEIKGLIIKVQYEPSHVHHLVNA